MRISRDQMFFEIIEVLIKRATCSRAQVGAILVKDGRIISTGYNGSPSGTPHCLDSGCIQDQNGSCIRTVHAEANAIVFAAKHGISTNEAVLYVSLAPCLTCAKLVINAGVKEVVYRDEYHKPEGLQLLRQSGILVRGF